MTASHPAKGIDSADLRRAFACHPSGIVLVTGIDEAGPVGLAVATVVPISLDPPMLGFLPGKSSKSWQRIHRVGSFAVNVLSERQEDLCSIFSSSGGDKFAGVGWTTGPDGQPIIEGVAAWFECTISQAVHAGDHYFVMGEITGFRVASSARPLVFFRSSYSAWRLEAREARSAPCRLRP